MSEARLFVLALRRSGSTIFWETLRQDPRFVAFNEPFNPYIRRVSEEDWMALQRRHYGEYEALLKKDPDQFWRIFDAIYEIQELKPAFSVGQQAYLQYLLDTGDHVLLETTRCHFKLAALRDIAGSRAVVVHLYRSPEGFATSHLLPSSTDARRKLVTRPRRAVMLARGKATRALRKRTFWRRRKRYGWAVEEVIGDGERSAFFSLARRLGLDSAQLEAQPAVGRLMAYWTVAFRTVERDGPEIFGDRFVSVHLERWLLDPEPAMTQIYTAMGLEPPVFDYSHLRAPSPPFDAENPQWSRYRELLGIEPTIARSPSLS